MAAGERPPDPGGRTVSRSCRQPTVPGNEGRDGSARERVAEADDGGTCQALPTLLADYVKRARALLAEMRDLDASLHDQSQTPRGTITLAADSVVREFLLPILVPGFHARYPEVEIHVSEAGAVRDLACIGADMLLQTGWPPQQDAILRTLAETRWLVVATPAYWARHGQPRRPADLAVCEPLPHDRLRMAA